MMRSAAQASIPATSDILDEEIYALLEFMQDRMSMNAGIIPWSCPVPVFGDPAEAVVATVGLNPSNREFVDQNGHELEGAERRFQTLKSLNLRSWAQAERRHAKKIADACRTYFASSPYDLWFKALDKLIQGTGASLYPSARMACHLDLVPFATTQKWTALTAVQRSTLLAHSCRTLARLLSSSPIRTLVLNGATVVREVQHAFHIRLSAISMPAWNLPRGSGESVRGLAYVGTICSIAGVPLQRRITVLGYNHNIQSSFGVTREVRAEIARWIMRNAGDSRW